MNDDGLPRANHDPYLCECVGCRILRAVLTFPGMNRCDQCQPAARCPKCASCQTHCTCERQRVPLGQSRPRRG